MQLTMANKRANILAHLSLFVTFMCPAFTQIYPNCPQANKTNALQFSNKPGNLAITCDRQSVDLICCIEGYSEIKWYKERTENDWREIQLSKLTYMPLEDNNQTLRIVDPSIKYHKTRYMCVARDSSNQTINNTFYLDVRECTNWNDPPAIVQLTSNNVPITPYVNLTCKVFQGGRDNGDSLLTTIFWIKSSFDEQLNKTMKLYLPFGNTHNATVNITQWYAKHYFYSSLTVPRLSSSQNFTCVAMNVFGSEDKFIEVTGFNSLDLGGKKDQPPLISYLGLSLILAACIFVCFAAVPVILYCIPAVEDKSGRQQVQQEKQSIYHV